MSDGDPGCPAPLRIAVVGHTNTGKTSLLRTLTRDQHFGEVSDHPATTRHVEGVTLVVRGRLAIELYDTPGLEDSVGLLQAIEVARGGRRLDGIHQVQSFLASGDAESGGRFEQEAKSLRQVLFSDLALYVIDARDQVLGKHRDELEILAWCARPIVPVLNFTVSSEARVQHWREHLSRANLHAIAEFDTVVRDDRTERRLLEKMRSLLDGHQDVLTALIDERRRLHLGLRATSWRLVADMLIDIAAYQISVPTGEQSREQSAIDDLRRLVRDREQRCVEQLLQLHRFSAADVVGAEAPLLDGRWGIDLFNPAAMKQLGLRTGGGVAAGAVAGFTIDAIVGGLTLGAATAIGAAIGGTLGVAQAQGRRMLDRLRGRRELSVDDNTLRVLVARQSLLVQSLQRRGHASVQPLSMQEANTPARTFKGTLPREIDEIRAHPSWSRLGDSSRQSPWNETARDAALERLAQELGASPINQA